MTVITRQHIVGAIVGAGFAAALFWAFPHVARPSPDHALLATQPTQSAATATLRTLPSLPAPTRDWSKNDRDEMATSDRLHELLRRAQLHPEEMNPEMKTHGFTNAELNQLA